jgi:2-polyprenyl-3-methyl-5-hydroxy-6-metoxy-1,4-benzoquinol methylase
VEARKYFVEYHIPAFAEFERWRGKRVLEIGFGIGTDTINFARAGAQVTAVDLSEKSVELARKRATVFGLEDCIRFRTGNAEQLSSFVPLEPYDLIYSWCNSSHTASRRSGPTVAQVCAPRNDHQNHGLPSPFV